MITYLYNDVPITAVKAYISKRNKIENEQNKITNKITSFLERGFRTEEEWKKLSHMFERSAELVDSFHEEFLNFHKIVKKYRGCDIPRKQTARERLEFAISTQGLDNGYFQIETVEMVSVSKADLIEILNSK